MTCHAALLLALFADGPPPDRVDFSRDVRPILSDACFACHGPDAKARKARLRLDTREAALSVLAPGKADESELMRRLVHDDPVKRMPPAKSPKKVTPAQVATLRRWIDQGAPYTEHWAFVPPRREAIPAAAGARTPIDRFVLARLAAEKLSPSPEAPPAALLRRVTLDLTGLPPTPAELDAFLSDKRPDAYERAVDRLLDSPRFGEHQARFWLDLARFGDTHGLHLDNYREMHPYRDWAIAAFNANKPYDRFLTEQLAGDLLPGGTLDDLVATGFNRAHVTTSEGGSITEEVHIRNVNDRVETVGTVFLALTVGCAKCHDHKYDPITQKDFYSLSGYFNSLEGNPLDGNLARHPPTVAVPTPDQARRLAAAKARLDAARKALAEKAGGRAALMPLKQEAAAAEAEHKALDAAVPVTYVFRETPKPRQAYVLKRGEYDQRGEPVGRGVPAFLPKNGEVKTRLDLAKWLLDEKNPLTARVAVNRLWQQLYGTGLVKTSEDFGLQSEPPSHPELLDWLAVEFRESGWDVKRMMRLMVLSGTYRQSSRVTKESAAKDPANRLLSRGPRFRLDAEMLRDQALFASGLLVEHLGGPSVKPPQPPGLWKAVAYPTSSTATFVADKGEKVFRRGLYTFWKRTAPPPQMTTFDAPSRESCLARRERTNTPLQALLLLNDPQYVEASRALAERSFREAKGDEARVARLFRLATCRAPEADEAKELLAALNDLRAEYRADPAAAKKLVAVGETKADGSVAADELAAWTMLASTVLNLDEVLNK